MIGKPIFSINDKVSFNIDNNNYTGYIYIVDKTGTFEDESDVSYDIMVNNWGDTHDKECLFKHVNQKLILRTIDKKELITHIIKNYCKMMSIDADNVDKDLIKYIEEIL